MARTKSAMGDGSSDFDQFVYPIEKFRIDTETLEKAEIVLSYFRQFPYAFAEQYLGLKLYEFQKILLYNMMHKYNVIGLACRNLGKTWITAVYIVTRCILYAKTKVIIVAPERSQSAETITKIKELMIGSPQLREEISYISDSVNTPKVTFWNGSTVRTVTMSEMSRSKRANLVVIDEYVWTDKDIIDNVITNFLGDPRSPEYLKDEKYFGKPEYEYLKEKDTEIYLSSAGFKGSWAYQRFEDYFKKMVKGEEDYFVCDIPYQTAVSQGMRSLNFYKKQMKKDGFDIAKGNAEYRGFWIPDGQNGFYRYEALNNCRSIRKAIYPKELSDFIDSKNKKFIDKKRPEGCIRICGGDISIVGSKINDASAYGVLQLTPKYKKVKTIEDGNEKIVTIPYYDRELIYLETHEGMLAKDQANRLKKLFYEYDCQYMVIDAMSAGAVIVQMLGEPSVDNETFTDYEPFMCCNKDEYAEMCNYPNAKKVLYCINASAQSNHDMNQSLQVCIGQGKLKLLTDENMAKDYLRVLKGYDEFPNDIKSKLLNPYINQSMMIREMVALERKATENGLIKLREPSGQRKDRYSCILYLNGIADDLESKLKQPTSTYDESSDIDWYFEV